MKFLIRVITNNVYGVWRNNKRLDKTFLLAMSLEEAQKRIDKINKKEEKLHYIFNQEIGRNFQTMIIPVSDNFSHSKPRWINSENLNKYIERSYI